MLESVEITSSIISGVATIVATIIAAIAASLIGRKFSNIEALKKELTSAKKDVLFLLEVEKIHCKKHKDELGESFKNRIRKKVTEEKDINWSGKFTSSRMSAR